MLVKESKIEIFGVEILEHKAKRALIVLQFLVAILALTMYIRAIIKNAA